jgi:AraC-like DNA-binding protein
MQARYEETHPPSLDFQRIETLWSFRPSARGMLRVLPDARMDLLARFRIDERDSDGKISAVRLVVAGPACRFSTVPADVSNGFLGIRFRPGWGGLCLGLSPRTIRNEVLTGQQAIDTLGALAAPLLRARTVNALRLAMTDAARALAARGYPDAAAARAIETIELLHQHGGRYPAALLAEAAGTSARTLRRDMDDAVGMPARTLGAVFRFQHTMRLLRLRPNIGLSTLAQEAGYSDQAHMTREFRTFGGFTPGAVPDLPVINLPA